MRVATAGIGLRAGWVLSLLKEAMPEITFVGYYDPQPTHLEMIGTDVPRWDDVATMLAETQPDRVRGIATHALLHPQGVIA